MKDNFEFRMAKNFWFEVLFPMKVIEGQIEKGICISFVW